MVRRESSFNPAAENTQTRCAGLFQVHPYWHRYKVALLLGRPELVNSDYEDEVVAALKLPEINVQIAYELWLDQGWYPWRLQ